LSKKVVITSEIDGMFPIIVLGSHQKVGRISFLPWDAMHSTDCAVTRCPTVCLSVTRQYLIETAKHIITLFQHRVATPF